MVSITKGLSLVLIGLMAISCMSILTVESVNAQSTPAPEISVLYPTNGTFFNVSMGVESFQLKYATNSALSWIGYSVDGSQNRTAYGEWFDLEQRLYDAEGNPSVWVYGVFENDGNHNLTLYANNTAGAWATPQTVTYFVNINADTTIPPTTSNPTTIESSSLSPTSTPMPTINTGSLVELPPIQLLVAASGVISFVILSFLLYRRHRKTANLSKQTFSLA